MSTSGDYTGIAHRASTRVAVLFGIAALVTIVVGLAASWVLAPAAGWVCGSGTYLALLWTAIGRLGPEQTAKHATREDPTRAVSEILLLGASIASFAALALLLAEATNHTGIARAGIASLALVTVALSWALVHTLFTLQYAAIYYVHDASGIDFNENGKAQYSDFAYLSFTVGMTFQVSDTDLTSHPIRAAVLRHALLSYLFGAVVLATTINLVAGLSH